MKNYYIIALLFFTFTSNAQVINFPDPNFKANLISQNFDLNVDGEIDQTEALQVINMVLDNPSITSLEGLEYFHNLASIWCTNLQITELNLCQTSVKFFNCTNLLNLVSINLKNNVESEWIFIEPPFPPFILNNVPALQYFCCDASELAATEDNLFGFNVTPTTDCFPECATAVLNNPTNELKTGFTIAPNPVANTFTINSIDGLEIAKIEIFNSLGQRVKSVNLKETLIEVSELNSGVYFISVISNKGIEKQKFLKL
ncbi:T9SS type A sorting domain-containing protein [Flavobacterium sp.]|uniref:T9SS type A sorting domain-containing protein n=1 Tax=Flavobacterium sp. TaxID=239 RepID=UPI002B4B92F2|nr:T9SS type A sorting domain-containing protein [Flavobacterium sp.]HLP64657.1 T9SS type A sorting domain-containing protein [Flavobacterium sp.]